MNNNFNYLIIRVLCFTCNLFGIFSRVPVGTCVIESNHIVE